ncbi:hypothetical protein QR680_014187 [Steinernema hermaphroditum]|uniref:Uncharacterized protein n=1 Tax=Steinernema hermaphroditum TaxID=289476 RepID=A0AA39I9D7_9BILA|nr:hypothetical protein QR680_014187 [Steinernema hermaphroditum]
MDAVPALFYDHLFQVLGYNARHFTKLPGNIGRLAKSFLKEDYEVTVYISEHFYAEYEFSTENYTSGCLPCTDVSQLVNEANHMSLFKIVVFGEPQKSLFESEEERKASLENYKVSREDFQKLLQAFVHANRRKVSIYGLNERNEHTAKDQLANFDAFQKYLLPCHELYCSFSSFGDKLHGFFKAVPSFVAECPALMELCLSWSDTWPPGMTEAAVEFLRTPHSRVLRYATRHVSPEPSKIVSLWMSLETRVPSKRTFEILTKQKLDFLRSFPFAEISRESVKEHSQWANGEIEKHEDENMLKSKFFRLQHPTCAEHCLIVFLAECETKYIHQAMYAPISTEQNFFTRKINEMFFV